MRGKPTYRSNVRLTLGLRSWVLVHFVPQNERRTGTSGRLARHLCRVLADRDALVIAYEMQRRGHRYGVVTMYVRRRPGRRGAV
jgi:hypothetical protein